MKKFLLTLTLAVLLTGITACSERPPALEETRETVPETEPYSPPEKTYLAALTENLGYQDFPDSIHCYTEPLIPEESFVDPSQIAFGEEEPRFISWNHMYELEIDAGDYGMLIDTNPNGNFLTDEDGDRVKLCPYEWCRDDVNEACTHLDLSAGAVAGDWVYFVGSNFCMGAPDHPNKDDIGHVNMLLRYSVTGHTIEKVLDLPGNSSIQLAHRGVIFVRTTHPTANIDYLILADGVNGIAAKVSGIIDPNTAAYGDSVYKWELGRGLVRYSPSLEEEGVVFADNNRNTRKVIGTCEDGILLMNRTQNADGTVTDTITCISEKGKETVLLKDHPQAFWCVAGDTLYCTPMETRHVFNAVFGENTREYTVSTAGNVITYPLSDTGSYTTVFSESQLDGEFLNGCQAYGNSVRLSTILPQTEAGAYPLKRSYVLQNGKLIFDGEEEYRSW